MSAIATPPVKTGTIGATPLPPSPVPLKPFRWTIADYRKLALTGLFHDKKTMLLDGVLYVMGMPNPPHDEALNLTQEFLRATFPAGHHVRNQQGFEVGAHSDPGPDLAVVTGAIRDYHGQTPTSAVMIVEIADTTLFTDTTTKAELCATAGVPEYWVLDIVGRQLHIFRDPQSLPAGLGATAYKTHVTLGLADSISPLAASQASIQVGDLLP